jgi:hypothetical protein
MSQMATLLRYRKVSHWNGIRRVERRTTHGYLSGDRELGAPPSRNNVSYSSLNKELPVQNKNKDENKNRKSVETSDGILLFSFFVLFFCFFISPRPRSHTRRNEVPEQKRKEKKPIHEGKDEPSA